MNLFNQPVSQSFQTVVSLNSDNTITNGTGSIVSLLNVTASNAISSNVAVSSSYSPTQLPDITDDVLDGIIVFNSATVPPIYVGINQNTPQVELDVNGTIADTTLYGFCIANDGSTTYFNTNGGRLGIGTSTPYYELDVAGTTHSSNGYQLPDYTTISSPAEGLLAYNFTTHHTTVYNGTTWI